MGEVQKKVKKTNNSALSATHTYIKLTLVSFFFTFFFAPSPKCEDVQSEKKTQMFIRVHYSKAFSTNPGTW